MHPSMHQRIHPCSHQLTHQPVQQPADFPIHPPGSHLTLPGTHHTQPWLSEVVLTVSYRTTRNIILAAYSATSRISSKATNEIQDNQAPLVRLRMSANPPPVMVDTVLWARSATKYSPFSLTRTGNSSTNAPVVANEIVYNTLDSSLFNQIGLQSSFIFGKPTQRAAMKGEQLLQARLFMNIENVLVLTSSLQGAR